jgi:hypothetical protein
VGCAKDVRTPDNPRAASALLVLPEATEVQPTRDYDGAVRYQLEEAYPATKAIEFISSTLEKDGWTKADRDLFNPGIPLFDESGWGRGRAKGEIVVSWNGQWKDREDNWVLYYLAYRMPGEDLLVVPSGKLHVQAIFMGPEIVAMVRAEASKSR